MSHPRGTPFDNEPDADLSIDGDPFAEFLSESDIERPTIRPERTPHEVELFAYEGFAVEALSAGRFRSLGPALSAAATVAAILVGGLTGLMMRGSTSPSDERIPQPVLTADVGRLASDLVPQGAAAEVPLIEQVPLPTSSGVPAGARNNDGSHAVAPARVTDTARGAGGSGARRSTDSDVQAARMLVPPAQAPVLWAPTLPSHFANPAIPTLFAPANVRVAAMASDPDGDELTYQWSAPTGRWANATERETVYTCPDTPTTVALTVTVTDSRGGIASDTLTIDCVEPR